MQGASCTYNLPVSLKRQFVLMHKVSLRSILILGFCFTSFLLAFYIFQVREYTQAGFAISSYESSIAKISKESKSLELNFTETNSLASLETLLKMMNYENVSKIRYIRMTGSQVAAKSN